MSGFFNVLAPSTVSCLFLSTFYVLVRSLFFISRPSLINLPNIYNVLTLFIAYGLSPPLQCKLQHSRELTLFTSLGLVRKTVSGSNGCSVNNRWVNTLILRAQRPCLSFFFFLATPQGMWDLSFPERDQTLALALEAPRLNHWTARESPVFPSWFG